ncbi:MAG: TPM domain-containing protein [Myxococcota bacterium]
MRALLLTLLSITVAFVAWVGIQEDPLPPVPVASVEVPAAVENAAPAPTSPEVHGPSDASIEAAPGAVEDLAGVFGGFGHTLEWQTQSWRDDLGISVHVLSLRAPDHEIAPLAEELFSARRIGADAPSGGLLILVNPARHEARIEVSYELEHVFPDLIVGRLARNQLAPYAAYRAVGMAVMDVLHFLKDYAYLQAHAGNLELDATLRERQEYKEKARYLSGGAGAQADFFDAAALLDRDWKAVVPAAKRARYAPSEDPRESAEAFLRTLRDGIGDPTLPLFTPGSQCMRDGVPFAPFEQFERLRRYEGSKPFEVTVQGDHAVLDSKRPAHGFVPILLAKRDGLWRVDLAETWKNLFFDADGDYWHKNASHPYRFGLHRFGAGANHDLRAWQLGELRLPQAIDALNARPGALDAFQQGELLYRNCWLPLEALTHYERALELAPNSQFFRETLGDRASYIGFHDLAVSAYEKLHARGWWKLAHAQRNAGDPEAALATARKLMERDPYRIEVLELVRTLAEETGDLDGASGIMRQIAAIRANPHRPQDPVTIQFAPARPTFDPGLPIQIESGSLYDHSSFGVTLKNTSARPVEIARIGFSSTGTVSYAGQGDIRGQFPFSGNTHRIGPGESITLSQSWGFTVPQGNEQISYVFDVCWKATSERRQCTDGRLDLYAQ